ncbi:conserved hypothetical protein [Candidatus Zixiibacteriota bacterium]|nr:conserved hypothetical protein [candidate division Zixibacteria bacterium]
MDSFENLMAFLMRREGYWVQTSFKVDLTKKDKIAMGRPTSPRWELDLLAYKAKGNVLRVIECKSFFDSVGVHAKGLNGKSEQEGNHYKIFNSAQLRRVVFRRLIRQLTASGLCRPSPKIILCLAAGNIATSKDKQELEQLFKRRKWELYDNDWLKARLAEVSITKYENELASIVAKILLRN